MGLSENQIPKRSGGTAILTFLLGLGLASLFAYLYIMPRQIEQAKKFEHELACRECKAIGLTLGIASGLDQARVERKIEEDSISDAVAYEEKKLQEQMTANARRKKAEPSNYHVVQTEAGYVIGEPIQKE